MIDQIIVGECSDVITVESGSGDITVTNEASSDELNVGSDVDSVIVEAASHPIYEVITHPATNVDVVVEESPLVVDCPPDDLIAVGDDPADIIEIGEGGGPAVLTPSGRRDHVLSMRGRARSSQALFLGGVATTHAPLSLERRARLTGMTLRFDTTGSSDWRMDVERGGIVIASLTMPAGSDFVTITSLTAQVELLDPLIVRLTNTTSNARSRWRSCIATLTFAEN